MLLYIIKFVVYNHLKGGAANEEENNLQFTSRA